MNILILADIEASGEWLALQTLIKELKRNTSNLDFYLIAYGKNRLLLNEEIFKDTILIQKPPLIRPFRYYRQIFLEFTSGLKTIKEFKTKIPEFNFIIITDYTLLLPTFVLLPHTKSIFFFQGFRHYYNLGIKNFNFYMFIRKYIERFCWLISGKIIAPSSYAKNLISTELGFFAKFKKIYILKNLVRDDFLKKYTSQDLISFRIKFRIPLEKKLILYCGLIDPRKGLEELILGFKKIIGVRHDLILIIAYLSMKLDEEYYKAVKQLIKKNYLSNKIILLKDLETENLAKLYQTAQLAILPSKQDMGSVFFLESIRSTLPIFSTKVGEAKDLLKTISSHFILKNTSPDIIFHALNNFFNKSSDWHENIKKRLKKIEKHLVTRNKKTVRLIKKILINHEQYA